MHKIRCEFKAQKQADGAIILEGFANPSTLDRGKELMDPGSWRLENYVKNPIVLFDHGLDPVYGGLPIGKAVLVEKKDGGLYAKLQISNSKTEKLTAIRDLVEEGILTAMSVGFDPGSKEDRGDGSKLIKNSELLEISIVPIPMHQDAIGSLTAVVGKSLSPTRSKTAKRWLETYKKKIQEKIVSDLVKTTTNKLDVCSISVLKNNMENQKKILDELKSCGYKVDNFIETSREVIFNQTNDKYDENEIISINLAPNITANLRIKKMADTKVIDTVTEDPKDKEGEMDKKPGDEMEKACDPDHKALGSMIMQSVVIQKDKMSKEEASKWVEDHNFVNSKMDETEDSYRFRQKDPGEFDPESFRTIEIKPGVVGVVGKLKEEEKGCRKEEGKKALPNPALAPIPTGPGAVNGTENPTIDLLKQQLVLLGTLINETQNTNKFLEKLCVETESDYNESDMVSVSDETNLQDETKSISSKEDHEFDLQIKKIKEAQERLLNKIK